MPMKAFMQWAPVLPACSRREARAAQSSAAYRLAEEMLRQAGYDGVTIAKDADGKPFVVDHPELALSVAHTATLAVCALAVGTAENSPHIGVDAEPCDSVTREKAIALAARFFAPTEKAAVHTCAAEEACEQFLRIFTQKEAYGKLIGAGLAATLATDTEDLAFTPQTGLYFQHFRIAEHHVTLCLPKGISLQL